MRLARIAGIAAGLALAVGLVAAALPADTRPSPALAFAGQGAPISLAARQVTQRCDPAVLLSFTDTNSQTVVFSKIRRRSTGADTNWVIRGYTTGVADSINATLRKRMTFRDDAVTFGKTYRYQVADSVSGAAVTAYSDSVSIAVTNLCRTS